ncbi:MAG: DUF4159 domain-containing protein [Pirellulaceae bacterium]
MDAGRRTCRIGVLLLCLLGPMAAAPRVSAQLTDEKARQAIQQGIRFLLDRRNASNGSWGELPLYPGGVTSLCTLALLNAGVDPKSPEIQQSLQYLRGINETGMVYSTALQTMVLCAAEPNRDRAAIARNVAWLENQQIKDGPRAGAWGYGQNRGSGGDNSNTQFALLGLYEAERVGVPVNQETWQRSLDYWLRIQRDDGSWNYVEREPSTGSMTCAGIASVIICSGQVNQGDARVVGGRVECCTEQASNEAVERGLRWLGSRFSPVRNPGAAESYWYYYLYGVERVGRMSGRRFIGEHDWFRAGAEQLIAQRDTVTGHWVGRGAEQEPVIATALALLFLAKGRRPVVVSKLRYGDGVGWDSHRSAIAHLTARVEQRWKRDLSWQTLDIGVAAPEDLAGSPVLFLSGRDALRLSGEQEEHLRQYVNRGGVIFAEAACGGAGFDRDFRALVKRIFPDSPLRLLPPDHPVWFAEQPVDPDYIKPLYGIDACCRTSVIYCPQDLSCYWELHRGTRRTGYPAAIQSEMESALRIGANVLTYATNRELRNKLDQPRIAGVKPPVEAYDRGTFHLPKLVHDGGSDDAPNALPNFLQFLQSLGVMRATVENRRIAATDPLLFDYPIVFLHGRRDFQFSPAERKALKTYLDRGGVLFADAICANPEFAEAFRREMELLFPGRPLARIPPEHPLFTRAFRGFDLRKVTLRDPQFRAGDDPLRANLTQVSPVLEGLAIEDRLAVILSPFDLSCALENGASLECKGYIKEDAARLAVNVVLFVLQQ